MDVRCERCQARYVVDDALVKETGLAVRCSKCGHLFRVTRPARGWRLRRAGAEQPVGDMSALQKLIVEGKASPDDEVSRDGGPWLRAGDLDDLEPFFTIVEKARRAPATAGSGAAPSDEEPTLEITESASDEWEGPAGGTGTSSEPAWAAGETVESRTGPERGPQPRRREGGSRLPWALAALAVVVAGGTALYLENPAWFRLEHPSSLNGIPPAPGTTPAPATEVPPAAMPPAPAPAASPAPELAPSVPPAPAPDAGLVPDAGPGPVSAESVPPATSSPQPGPAASPSPHPSPDTAASPPAATPGPIAPAPQASMPAPPEPAPAEPGAAAPAPERAPATVRAPAAPDRAPASPPAAAQRARAAEGQEQAGRRETNQARTLRALLADARRLRDRGRSEAALDTYARAVQLDPSNPDALAGRGLCYLDLSQYVPAEESFKAALAANADNAAALMGLAETYRYEGRRAEAVTYYRKYLAVHPQGEDATAARNAISALEESP